MKTGSVGDPVAALRLESWAGLLNLVGCLLIAAYALAYRGASLSQRVANAAGILLIGWVFMWFCGSQLEILGVQYCHRGTAP